MAQVVKKLLLAVVLLLAGCHCDSRVPIKPTDKVDRQSELYREVLHEACLLRLMEHELQEYHKWADKQDANGVTNGTEF